MKKFVTMLCVLCLLCCLTACGEKKGTESSASKSPTATAAVTTAPKPTEKASEVPSEKPTVEATTATATSAPSTEAPTASTGPVDITKLTNVALDMPVTEQGHAYESDWWNKNFLTDGFKMEDDNEGQTNGWMWDASENIDDETWVYVDLEDTYKVQAVAIYPRESESFFPVAYEIQLSKDAEAWTTVHTVTEDYGYLDTNRVFEITPTEASYVRILVKERCDLLPGGGINGYIAEISEIEVYA